MILNGLSVAPRFFARVKIVSDSFEESSDLSRVEFGDETAFFNNSAVILRRSGRGAPVYSAFLSEVIFKTPSFASGPNALPISLFSTPSSEAICGSGRTPFSCKRETTRSSTEPFSERTRPKSVSS